MKAEKSVAFVEYDRMTAVLTTVANGLRTGPEMDRPFAHRLSAHVRHMLEDTINAQADRQPHI